MPRFAQRAFLMLVFAVPLQAFGAEHDPSCDKQNIDVSKMSSEAEAAMREKCTAQLRAEDCGINGIDLSMMSTNDQKAMKDACVDKMKDMGCSMKGVNVSKLSVADTQKLMDQCHEKLVADEQAKSAPKSSGTPATAPPNAG